MVAEEQMQTLLTQHEAAEASHLVGLQAVRAEGEEARQQLEEAREKVQQLQAEMQAQGEELEASIAAERETKTQLEAVSSQLGRQTVELEEVQAGHTDVRSQLERQLEVAQAEYADVRGQLEGVEVEMECQQVQWEEAMAGRAAAIAEAEEARAGLATAVAEAEEAMAGRAAAVAEAEVLKSVSANFDDAVKGSAVACDVLTEQVAELQGQLDEAMRDCEAQQATIDGLLEEVRRILTGSM